MGDKEIRTFSLENFNERREREARAIAGRNVRSRFYLYLMERA